LGRSRRNWTDGFRFPDELASVGAAGFSSRVRDDIFQLRQYLGSSYPAVINLLNAKNQILLNNTQRLAPAQAAQIRAHMQAPPKLFPISSPSSAPTSRISARDC
jgi:hypothetical protein